MLAALERLRDLIFPDSELRMEPNWFNAFNDMYAKYMEYEAYYSGSILEKKANPEDPENKELKYPLQINLVRQWTDMVSGYLFGQYTDDVVNWIVERKPQRSGNVAEDEEERCESMERILRENWWMSGNNAMADYAAIGQGIYGGMVLKTLWDNRKNMIRDEWLTPDIFIPRWHPMNMNELLEVIVSFVVQKEDARDIFNLEAMQYRSLPDEVIVYERWKPGPKPHYELSVDRYTLENKEAPDGIIPHVYIPRYRSPGAHYGYFGISVAEGTMGLQNEINERMADIGDGVAYSSHPIRCLVNVTDKSDLEIGTDAVWDLGYGFGGKEPKAFTLDVNTNYKEAMEFSSSVERAGRMAASLPAIAFGEDEGSQRSGTTLLIRFLPLTQEIRRARLHMIDGLRQKAVKTLLIAAQHKEELSGVAFDAKDVFTHIIKPQLAPILPKDVQEKVLEWAQRIESGFGTPEEAYADLGHPQPKEAAEKALEYLESIARMEKITKGVQDVSESATAGSSNRKGGDSASPKVSAKADGSGVQKSK